MNENIMSTYKRWPVTFTSGSGSRLFDSNGREYLDFIAGLAVASTGHAHPRVAEAIADQAKRLIHVSNLYSTEPQSRLADKLADLTGGFRSFFANSGAEAIECALKLARRWAGTGRHRVVAAQGSFHGRTLGALTVTGQPAKQEPFRPLLAGVSHVAYDDPAALEDALDDDVCAVLLEPIQGEAGVIVPSDDYLVMARKLCDEAGALLILDEVQTGLGRTGRWFAHEHIGVKPDVMCLAKGLASGLPIGVCLARPEVASAFQPGDHATTFGGGPVQCAAALAVLRVIEDEDLVGAAHRRCEQLRAGMRDLFASRAEVRGRGLLIGAQLESPLAHELTAAALDRGLLVNNATADVLRVAPPLVVSEEEVDEGLSLLKEAFEEVVA